MVSPATWLLNASFIASTMSASIAGSSGVTYDITKLNQTAFQFVVAGPSSVGYAAIGIGKAMTGALMYSRTLSL